MNDIYGVDISKEYDCKNVRDAIIRCFIVAHGEVLEKNFKDLQSSMSENDFENFKRINANTLVRRFFNEIDADYENPTKENLIEVCNKLSEFSKSFRSEDIIGKHYNEIMQLLNNVN